MSFNGYKNYETWLFMLYFKDYLYTILQEHDEINDQIVYEMVEDFIDEMYDSIDENKAGRLFLNDLLNASLNAIDVKEVADVLAKELED